MIKLKPISWWFSWISTFPFLSAVYCSNWETVREHSKAVQMDLCYQKREYYLLPDVTLLSPLCVLAPALIWPHNKIIQSANPRGKKKKSNRTKRKEAYWISCVNQLFTHSDKYQSHSVRGPGECDCSIHSHCEIGKCQSASSLRLNHLKSLNKALQHHGQSTETSLMVLFEVSRTNCFWHNVKKIH